MKKIKIVFYSHTIDFAGTWRSHERILLNINKDIFEPYVLYNKNIHNNRLDFLKSVMDKDKLIGFSASKTKSGPENGYSYLESNFSDVIRSINPDIIHFARSGYYEWPFVERLCPIQIETNIFAGKDNSPFLDFSITICNTINNYRGGSDCVIYNPIPESLKTKKNLRSTLGIDEETFVLGRIGRADNFASISLEACKILKKNNIKFKYIIISPCQLVKSFVENNDLSDEVIFIEPTNDDEFIHEFYNTLNVFAHYRSDGECHSTAIAQAMAYGLPVVSHYAGWNGQVETIGNGGFVCETPHTYAEKIIQLMSNQELYQTISKNSLEIFKKYSFVETIPKFEESYINLYNNLVNR